MKNNIIGMNPVLQKQERGFSVDQVIENAQKMEYDSIAVVGIKDGKLSVGFSTSSTFELLGAMNIAQQWLREEVTNG